MKNRCGMCKIEKDASAFSKNSKGKNGLDNRCKECRKFTHAQSWTKISKRKAEYHQENKRRLQDRKREALKERRRTDPFYRLKLYLRWRMRKAIKSKGLWCPRSSLQLLGADIATVVKHIESKFKPGMTWDNHGEWHLDHIRPFASIDMNDSKQVQQVCHYTNIQPLWAKENLQKGRKWQP